MWNRKNSVAIQSYSAKANKPEPEEKKRVSYLDFTVFPTDIRLRVEMMWSGYFTTPAHASQRDFEVRVQINSILWLASKMDWHFNKI